MATTTDETTNGHRELTKEDRERAAVELGLRSTDGARMVYGLPVSSTVLKFTSSAIRLDPANAAHRAIINSPSPEKIAGTLKIAGLTIQVTFEKAEIDLSGDAAVEVFKLKPEAV